jgi:hypothetical protein
MCQEILPKGMTDALTALVDEATNIANALAVVEPQARDVPADTREALDRALRSAAALATCQPVAQELLAQIKSVEFTLD